jgi:hypothetical protein
MEWIYRFSSGSCVTVSSFAKNRREIRFRTLTLRIRCSVQESDIVGRMRVQRRHRFSADLTDGSWKGFWPARPPGPHHRCGLVVNPTPC